MVDRIVGRIQLDQVEDVEARPPQQAEQLTVRQLPLDAGLAGPLQATETALGAEELFARHSLAGRAENGERAVAEEPEPTARPEQPVRLGEPEVGVAPDAGAVLGDREVEALGGQRDVLGARLDEWKLEPELHLAPPRRRELGRSDVDADRARAPPGEPRRDVGRAAAELDDVEPFDLTQRPERRLRESRRRPR